MAKYKSEFFMKEFVRPPNEINTPERSLDSFFEHDILRYKLAEPHCKNQVVLDLGCGLGYGASLLSENAAQVIGVDYSTPTIKFALRAYSNPKLSFFVSDARRLGVKSKTFDVVVSIEVFNFIRESNLFLKEIRRVLKEGGTFIMSTPNKTFYQRDQKGLKFHYPYNVTLVNFKDLKRVLNYYFNSVEIFGIRTKRGRIYQFLRDIDFLNIRLLLSHKSREVIAPRSSPKGITFHKCIKARLLSEVKKCQFLNAHTFQGFLAICK